MTLLSVVVPVYGTTAYLGQALASVRAQAIRPEQMVVVDDGGHDTSLDALGVPVIHLPENRGIGIARNVGAAYLHTDYIGFLDADDYYYPGALVAMLAALGDHPQAAFAYGDYTENGMTIRPPAWTLENVMRCNVASYCTLWRREAFWKIGGFRDLRAVEDWELARRAARAGLQAVHAGVTVFEHRQHAGNLSKVHYPQYGGIAGLNEWLTQQGL